MHIPTEATRAVVENMASYGFPTYIIALELDIDTRTLEKHYKFELHTAPVKKNMAVARVLYKKCVEDEDTTCIMFWLRSRAGWRDKGESLTPASEELLTQLVKMVNNQNDSKS